MEPVERRAFLFGSIAALAAAACTSSKPSTAAGTAAPTSTAAPTGAAATPTSVPVVGFTTAPFSCGVASGDPQPDRVVLWTRLDGDGAPAGARSDGTAPVAWQVATDEAFGTVVAEGTATAMYEDGFSVHVDATGLHPDTRYWYRFRVDAFEARGRTRTAPADGQRVDTLRFGFGSCQDFQGGFYAAHRDVAASDLDLFVWLGDYIYEYAAVPGAPRQHTGGACTTLEDYRARYALYRHDPDLRAAHAACPWLVIWDDHEVQNNYAGDRSENATLGPEAFLARRALAYRAWWEFMPTRLPRPTGSDLKIYRELSWGSLANVFLLDGRQYRSDQACNDAILSTQPPCADWATPERTMLGTEQERWLLDGIAGSTATWNILGNQVVMGDARLNGAVLNYDQWDGYPAARQRLLGGIAASGRRNVVVVTGDIHLAAVADLRADGATTTVATELVGTSISSGALLPAALEGALALFPALKYLNVRQRGWVRNVVTADRWTAEYRVVADVTRSDAAVSTDATFTIAANTPGAVRA